MYTDWDQLFINICQLKKCGLAKPSFHARYMSLLNKYIPTQQTSTRLNSAPFG